MLDILLDFLKKAEGFRANAYLDSEGLPTVGYGRLLSSGGPGWNGQHFDNINSFNNLYPNGITQEDAEVALEEDAQQGIRDAVRLIGEAGVDWETLSPVRQAILANVAFNLGYGRFKKFGGVWKAAAEGNAPYVVIELLDSLRARQIKRRAALEAVAFLMDDAKYLEI